MLDDAVLRGLIANFLITLFFVAVWAYLTAEVTKLRHRQMALLAGVAMGMAAAFTMNYSVPLSGGLIIDMRSVPIAAAGLVGGPLAALVAGLIAVTTRLAIGGDAALFGAASIALAATVGVVSCLTLRRAGTIPRVMAFSVTVAALPLVPMFFLPVELQNTVALCVFNFVGALASASALELSRRRAAEKRLLQAAVSAAPEYLYVKDTKGRFVAYNAGVAAAHRAGPTGLLGKSDLDLEGPVRGEELFSEEQQLFKTGVPISGKLDRVPRLDGPDRLFRTSKTVVADADGLAMGLVGITLDVTSEMAREEATKVVVDRLSLVLSQMADGVALYDRDCRLIFCNDQYHGMFPMTQDVRVPGANLRNVLKAAIERGEQPFVPDDADAWIAGVIDGMVAARDEEVNLIDGRTLSVRNRPIEGFGFVSVVSDITETKRAETRLAMLSEQMRLLATRDGLTGLTNRRSLDELLEREMARSARTGEPISVLMVDVDHFKAYNDHYGHQQGDACLKEVAAQVKAVAGRATDVAARYGGEEFCIVLPDTAEDGAAKVADQLRMSVVAAALPHAQSEYGLVTVSIGIATYGRHSQPCSSEILLGRADQALYSAKRFGRDKWLAWTEAQGAAGVASQA